MRFTAAHRRLASILAIAALAALTAALVPSSVTRTAHAGGAVLSGSYTNAYGTRQYELYVPSGYHGQVIPLVVMLHGCTQTPDDFAAGTRMNSLAEQDTFFVVYPAQPSSANSLSCWNWFLPADQSRGAGEPSLIAGITEQVMGTYHVDANRVFVAGISAGAAMAVIMGATYPDLYAAIAVHSGLEYRAATDLTSALMAQETSGPDPEQQGGVAHLAEGSNARVVPTIVFHGDADTTVNVANAYQVVSQWAETNDYADDGADDDTLTDQPVDVIQGQVPGGHSYTKSLYDDAHGNLVMELWIVHGMGHAWSGGSSAGSYTDPSGPDASTAIIQFFMRHPKNQN